MTTTNDTPTREQIVTGMLRYHRRQLIRRGVSASSADAATAAGTDRWASAQAFAQGLEVVLANAVVGEDATMPDTAIGDDLDRICAIYGLTRSPGAGAQGNITITCTGTVSYAAGQECTSNKINFRYRVVAASSVTNGPRCPSSASTWATPPTWMQARC